MFHLPRASLHRPATILVCIALGLALAGPVRAQRLADLLGQVAPSALVPGTDRFGPPEGTPPRAPAYAGNRLLGWAYLNTDVTATPGYAGWPILILVGLGTDWRISGVKLVEHHEPLLLSGVPPERIDALVQSYVGSDIDGITSIAERRPVDLISGATVSMMAIGDSILRSAVLMFRQYGGIVTGGQAATPSDQADAGNVPLADPPMWHALWQASSGRIAVLAAALLVLTVIFFCQDWFARRPVLYDRLRLGFLAFTLLWLGWYAQAQLSVVNVLAFAAALRADFRWDAFLAAPLIFILWSATAVAVLFWNRGAFCGWLCPYGAAQELLNRFARALGLRQWAVPHAVHQRLGAIKYVLFLGLFGVSLGAFAAAERLAELEPFKTAIVLRFVRDWPFVLAALAPLLAGLVVERCFCRYLCPLGAALAIPARLRLFDWLRRHRDCGTPCQRCAHACPVQAIEPDGRINPNECIQCLHCQMLYHHRDKCPARIKGRRRQEMCGGNLRAEG
ncbi:Nitrous oxide reductase maturation protein NosR [Rhodovastum atsumiense]|uniref:4Fe-4S binding protein n=1 Tax=Rhodovastum atsumiense TaxID=504468 RepID=A0A5M6IYV4_9PROT|nr:4Fe-4S binding protein [Rhodovastum atsumiense]KAA5612548.1 4Fe-4S binding protein [Rhodovastum atsumiense]CAH2601367.1 Nitrous oxide reductase maturation protein NosR [Rhodovastum atsumiense]